MTMFWSAKKRAIEKVTQTIASARELQFDIPELVLQDWQRILKAGDRSAIIALADREPVFQAIHETVMELAQARAAQVRARQNRAECDAFLAKLDTAFETPNYLIEMPTSLLLGGSAEPIVDQAIRDALDKRPSLAGSLAKAVGYHMSGQWLAGAAEAMGSSYQNSRILTERRLLKSILMSMTVAKPAAAFAQREQQIVRAAGRLHVAGTITQTEWQTLLAHLAWSGGHCELRSDYVGSLVGTARVLMRQILEERVIPHQAYVVQIAQQIGSVISSGMPGAAEAEPHFDTSNRFFRETDMARSNFINADDDPHAVRLGLLPSGKTVGLAENTSVIVFGRPGSAKTQSIVIPFLLEFPGSCIVLDVKGELFQKTSKWRAENFGPVYRFAPGDRRGDTATYNYFDHVPSTPEAAAIDCDILAQQIVPEDQSSEPVWPLSAQAVVRAIATTIAVADPADDNVIARIIRKTGRNVPAIAEVLSLLSLQPEDVDEGSEGHAYGVLNAIQEAGTRHGLPALEQTAKAIHGYIASDRQRESVLLNARAALNPFVLSPTLIKACAGQPGTWASDWSPDLLRTQPGTTVYLCLSPSELTAYSGLVKLIFKQHIDVLERLAMDEPPEPGEPPVTFVLDEFPRLGAFEPALHLQDVGRGVSMRCLFAAQSFGQLSKVFGRDRALAIVSNCAASLYMQPGHEELELIEQMLGHTRSIYADRDEPLEGIAALRGPRYRDKIICVPPGERIMILDKDLAWKNPRYRNRMG